MEKNVCIALGYQSRVGKDTFANYAATWCKDRNITCYIFTISDKLYEITSHIQGTLNKKIQKDPALLQLIATDLRTHYGTDVWINHVMSEINMLTVVNAVIIVTDMRLKNEMDLLVSAGFTTVKILRPGRTIDRDPNHATEKELADENFDYTIVNDASIYDYFNSIDTLLHKLREFII